eukprot:37358-Eustigmatos_ZCMA.PRE.1
MWAPSQCPPRADALRRLLDVRAMGSRGGWYRLLHVRHTREWGRTVPSAARACCRQEMCMCNCCVQRTWSVHGCSQSTRTSER